MSVFPSWPWTNFHEENLSWVIKTLKECKETVKECKETVEEALADVSNAVATYFASHIDTTLTQSGKAADAAAVGQKITNLNSNYTTLNGTVGGLTTSVSNINTEVGKKADAIVIDGDNSVFLKGNYTALHTLLADNHKGVDVWVKSGTVYYKALQVKDGPDNRVIIMCKYADSRFHYLGCNADNTITEISSDPSYCVIFDITNNTVLYSTKVIAYSTIKTMYDNYGPYDIVVKISNFDQAIPYNVWFNGADTLKITYRDSADTKHTISLTRSGTMTVS